MKLFLLTLKDKGKTWLNVLRPRRIRNRNDFQTTFLHKFFSTHRTSTWKKKYQTSWLEMEKRFLLVGRDSRRPLELAHTTGFDN